METKKVLGIIFSLLFVGAFAFVLSWGIINFNKVKDGMSGTGIYTKEDINKSYEDGYNTALTDKEEYTKLIASYRDTITTLKDNISQLNSQIAILTNNNKDYANQVESLNNNIEELNNQLNTLEKNKQTEIDNLNLQITNLQSEINRLNSLLENYQTITGEKVEVDFYDDNGIFIELKVVNYGSSISTSDIPSIESTELKIFKGWRVNTTSSSTIDVSSQIITKQTKFYALFDYYYKPTFELSWIDYTTGQVDARTLTANKVKKGGFVQSPIIMAAISPSLYNLYEITDYLCDGTSVNLATYSINKETTFVVKLRQKTLSELSWDTIKNISKYGYASKFFAVGDEKDITLTNNDVLTLVILDFNHDDGFAEDKPTLEVKNKITFGLKNLMSATQCMNRTATNNGGWYGSYMSEWLNNDVYSMLPEDLKTIIVYTNKRYLKGGANNTETDLVLSRLFLFSNVEITGTTENGYNAEGSQYSYYLNHEYSKKLNNGTGSLSNYWLRSSYLNNDSNFMLVGKGNFTTTNDANLAYGVSFGFCI